MADTGRRPGRPPELLRYSTARAVLSAWMEGGGPDGDLCDLAIAWSDDRSWPGAPARLVAAPASEMDRNATLPPLTTMTLLSHWGPVLVADDSDGPGSELLRSEILAEDAAGLVAVQFNWTVAEATPVLDGAVAVRFEKLPCDRVRCGWYAAFDGGRPRRCALDRWLAAAAAASFPMMAARAAVEIASEQAAAEHARPAMPVRVPVALVALLAECEKRQMSAAYLLAAAATALRTLMESVSEMVSYQAVLTVSDWPPVIVEPCGLCEDLHFEHPAEGDRVVAAVALGLLNGCPVRLSVSHAGGSEPRFTVLGWDLDMNGFRAVTDGQLFAEACRDDSGDMKPPPPGVEFMTGSDVLSAREGTA